jgi:hypothetical protein
MQSNATRAVADVLMFPIMLTLKLCFVAVRGVFAVFRFIIGVLLGCVDNIKHIPNL